MYTTDTIKKKKLALINFVTLYAADGGVSGLREWEKYPYLKQNIKYIKKGLKTR